MRALLFLALLLPACAALPPKPVMETSTIAVDRSALPASTLRLLRVATTSAPSSIVVQGTRDRRLDLPVYVYVFTHPRQGVVLIDAGFPRRTAVDVQDYPGKGMARTLGLTMEPGHAAVDRIAEAGIQPDEVRHLFLTHMHPDHVGGIEDFPGALLHVEPAEWEAREDRGALGKPDPSPWEGREVSAIPMVQESLGPFAAHADLFGDGSLIALSTPGHTAGHLSYLVNLPSRSYLITGDTAWTDPHWMAPALKSNLVRSLLEHDWETNWESQWRLHDFAAAQPRLVVLAGHELANETRLPTWPEAAR